MAFPNGFPIDNRIRILYTQIIRLEPYTGSITQKERCLYIEPPGYDINYHRNRSSSLVCRDD